jgi:hypothetical protein
LIDELLDAVFSYVGVGDYFFAACVCRRWRGRYIKLCYNTAAADKVDKLRTTFKSAFMTATRLLLAFKNGLEIEKLHGYEELADDIAKHSLQPIEALTVAKTYDMRYPESIAQGAAFFRRLHLLQWLHERRCPWSEDDVLEWAVRGGSVEILAWLQSVTAPWSDATKSGLMLYACDYDRLDAIRWLRETTGNGVCWDDWDCKALAAKQHISEAKKKLAAEMFAFAHQHGCPCTCDAAA